MCVLSVIYLKIERTPFFEFCEERGDRFMEGGILLFYSSRQSYLLAIKSSSYILKDRINLLKMFEDFII